MIWTWSISCDSSPAGKRSAQKSYTRLKKEALRFLYQCFPGGPLANQLPDRFSRQKNLSNTGETGLLPERRNDREIDASVTTNHLFLQHPPRTTGALLPISQPNSTFLGRKALGEPRGGRGGQLGTGAEIPVSISSHGNLCLMDPLPRLPVLGKKSRDGLAIVGRLRRQ